MAKQQSKFRSWKVTVYKGNEDIDVVYILARKKARAIRIGVLFASDYYGYKINDLDAKAEITKEKLTLDKHFILAGAEQTE